MKQAPTDEFEKRDRQIFLKKEKPREKIACPLLQECKLQKLGNKNKILKKKKKK